MNDFSASLATVKSLNFEFLRDIPSGGYIEQAMLPESTEHPDVPVNMSRWVVRPQATSVAESHDDSEIWLVARGSGTMRCTSTTSNDTRTIREGDFVYIPPNTEHEVFNESTFADLWVYSIWWL